MAANEGPNAGSCEAGKPSNILIHSEIFFIFPIDFASSVVACLPPVPHQSSDVVAEQPRPSRIIGIIILKAPRSFGVFLIKCGDGAVFFFARYPYKIAAFAPASLPRLRPCQSVTHGEEAEGPELDPRRGAAGGENYFGRRRLNLCLKPRAERFGDVGGQRLKPREQSLHLLAEGVDIFYFWA